MEQNCGMQKIEKEQYEKNATQEENLQSRAKAVADCVVQDQKGEVWEAGREGNVMTQKGSVQEMVRPYFVVSKWEEESGGTCG